MTTIEKRIRRTWQRIFNINVEAARRRGSRLPESLMPLSAHLKMLGINEEPSGNWALKGEVTEGENDQQTAVIVVSHKTKLQSTSTHNHPTRVERTDNKMGIKKSDAFPKKFLKVEDLGGRKVKVTIDRVEMEEVGDDEKPVAYFEEDSVKPLVLNVTNWSMIEEITGVDDTDVWSGATVVLYPDKTTYQGKRVPCIRIRGPEAADSIRKSKPIREPGEDDSEDAA